MTPPIPNETVSPSTSAQGEAREPSDAELAEILNSRADFCESEMGWASGDTYEMRLAAQRLEAIAQTETREQREAALRRGRAALKAALSGKEE